MPLTAKQLMQADDLQTQIVDVPEWAKDGDCQVMIRVMNGLAMSGYQARLQAMGRDDRGQRLMLEYVAACIIDPESKELVFDTPGGTEVLASKNGKGLQRIFEAATQLHLDDIAAAEEFRKNLPTTGGGSTGSTTPSSTDTDTPTP